MGCAGAAQATRSEVGVADASLGGRRPSGAVYGEKGIGEVKQRKALHEAAYAGDHDFSGEVRVLGV